MGIKNFTSLLTRTCPGAAQPISLSQLSNKVIAIDALLFARQFLHGSTKDADALADSETRVLARFNVLVEVLKAHKIVPVFCFDARQRMQQKQREAQKRLAVRERAVSFLSLEAERLDALKEMEVLVLQPQTTVDEKATNVQTPNTPDIPQLNQLKERFQQQHLIAKELRMKASGIITYEQSSQLVHSISSTDFSSSSFSELKSLILESTVRHDSLKTRTLLLSRQCLDDVRKQLEEQKIPIVDSPNEGEALCAYLTSTGRAYASATEDMDCCVFGDGPVIRYLARSVTSFHQSQSLSLALSTGASPFGEDKESNTASSGESLGKETMGLKGLEFADQEVPEFEFEGLNNCDIDGVAVNTSNSSNGLQDLVQIDPLAFRKELGLTREQYVDLMILCGSDFSSTLKRVGDKTALKLIKKHGSIEKILALGNYEPNEGFDYVGARRVFLEGAKQMEESVSMEELDEAIRVYRNENDIEAYN